MREFQVTAQFVVVAQDETEADCIAREALQRMTFRNNSVHSAELIGEMQES